MNPIEKALNYESSIKIIDEPTVNDGLRILGKQFKRYLGQSKVPTVTMPVLRGGVKTWLEATKGTDVYDAPIRMSHTGPDNSYIPQAICIQPPLLEHILLPDQKTARIAVFDGIMETVGTLIGLVEHTNGMITEHNARFNTHYRFPYYAFFILVDKSLSHANLDNIHAAFKANPNIWYHGVGADDKSSAGKERGREKNEIWGRLPNGFTGPMPSQPYYTKLF